MKPRNMNIVSFLLIRLSDNSLVVPATQDAEAGGSPQSRSSKAALATAELDSSIQNKQISKHTLLVYTQKRLNVVTFSELRV